jgi:hypothetical protein
MTPPDHQMSSPHHLDALKGLAAILLGSTTIALSLLEYWEAALRSISLMVSIAVGVVTIWSILKGKKRR